LWLAAAGACGLAQWAVNQGLVLTAMHARSAQMTVSTNARSCPGSDQTGQSRTRGDPCRNTVLRA